MRCPHCGAENRDERQFCGECGAKLDRTCPVCGEPDRDRARFCGGCGAELPSSATLGRDAIAHAPRDYTPPHLVEKILRSRAAVEGERKQVSVLFADIERSMDLAERLDPEEWHGVLDGLFKILTQGVHRFEGTVNQYTGDGIMALFGAPIAHEDHGQRACWAALHLRDEVSRYLEGFAPRLGFRPGLRIGVNSGEVVVGRIGDDLRMDYTAQGHTVGLAQRMEQLAKPGSVVLSPHTAQLVEGYFQLRPRGEVTVKGASEPLDVVELEGTGALRTRLDRSRASGFSPFVGRARELQTLEVALEHASRGYGQVVGVVGEAGVGKSRLCSEFVDICSARGVRVNEAHCRSHARNVPYLPLLELLRSFFAISEADPDRAGRSKIAAELQHLGSGLEAAAPLVSEFLGVSDPGFASDTTPDARKKQLVDVVRALLQARNQQGPSVILLDDVHWIDPGSDEFLAHMVDAAASTSVLLLLNFRPEYSAPWTGRSWYQQLPLVPLDGDSIHELLDELLGDHPSVSGLADRIAERTRGNPFFTEEVVQSLRDGGHLLGEKGAHRLRRPLEQIDIPASVQTVLAGRIDRLADRDKAVLQTAAVVGRRFALPVLEHVAATGAHELAAALSALEEAELVHAECLFPTAEYAFRHPLTQEAALTSQLDAKKREVSDKVARALIELYPDRHDEQSALIAQHFEDAGNAPEAVRWYGTAARWARSKDIHRAARHWGKVRALAAADKDHELALEARIELLHGSVRLGHTRQEVEDLYQEGLALAAGDDAASRTLLLTGYGRAFTGLGDLPKFLELAHEARELSKQTTNLAAQSDAYSAVTESLMFSGFVDRFVAASEEGLRRFEARGERGERGTFGGWRLNRAWGLVFQGHLEEARAELDRGLREAEEAAPEVRMFGALAEVHLAELAGEAKGALPAAQRTVELCEESGGLPRDRFLAFIGLSLAQLVTGHWEEAADAARDTIRILETERVQLIDEGSGWVYLADALVAGRQWETARDAAAKAVELTQKHARRNLELRALLSLALSRAHADGIDAEGIEGLLERADEVVKETGCRSMSPRIREARAELAALRGEESLHLDHLQAAEKLYREIGASGHVRRIAARLARVAEEPARCSSPSDVDPEGGS